MLKQLVMPVIEKTNLRNEITFSFKISINRNIKNTYKIIYLVNFYENLTEE